MKKSKKKKKKGCLISQLFKIDQTSDKSNWPNRVAMTKHDKPIFKAASRYSTDNHLPTKATSSWKCY